MKKFFIFSFVCFINLSCTKLFIKPDATSTPEKNFEIFWNDVHNGYPYFEEDNINWVDRYNQYKPSVTSSTSILQLYTIMTDMLKGFSDGHLEVSYAGKTFSNEKTRPTIAQLVKEDGDGLNVSKADVDYYYNFHSIVKAQLDISSYNAITASNGIPDASDDTVCIYGYLSQDKILYINLTSFLTQYRFDNLLLGIFKEYPDAKGLILDLRMNGGGNLGTMWQALSVFVPQGITEVKYAFNKEKVGPLPQNFGPETYFAINGNNQSTNFTKPVVVLANKLTVSAAEHAVMAMKELRKKGYKRIKVIGDNTFGATSFIVERTLPCGIGYTLVNNKTSDINHVVVERTGVAPDEYSYITLSKIQSGIDEQLSRAREIIATDSF